MADELSVQHVIGRHHDLIIGAGNTLPAAGFLKFDINIQ